MCPSKADIQGIYKKAYVDKIKDLVPDSVHYCKEIPAVSKSKQPGESYSQSVTLTSEQGITMSTTGDAFDLNAAVSMNNRQATIQGHEMVLRAAFSYSEIFDSKTEAAFISATKLKVKNMINSMYFFDEVNKMWGQSGVGVVSSVSSNTVALTAASFASGLWLGSENREYLFETSGGVLRGTASVSSYDISARTVTFDSLPAGVASTDVLRIKAQGLAGANVPLGIYDMITSNSTLFGIPQTYGLWKSAGTYPAGSAPLSFNKLMNAISQGVNKGLGNETSDIEAVVSIGAWNDLNKDQAALRDIDSSYKREEGTNGFENIVYSCTAGRVRIIPLKTMKEGFAWIHPKASSSFERVGSQADPTFGLPGQKNGEQEEYLRVMENSAGVETRLYCNTSLFTPVVHQMVLINGIVNSAS